MIDLIANTDLEIGQETVAPKSGGNKYPTTVPQGIYLVEANRYAAFGKTTKYNSYNEEKPKQVQDRIRFGFEILKCIVPIDPAAEEFNLVKEFGEVKEHYTVDINNALDFNRSEHAKSPFPGMRDAIIGALPISVVEKIEDADKTVGEVYRSLKQVVGQQFLIYVYEEKAKDEKGYSRNYINISAEKAALFTKANLANGIKFQVKEGMQIFPIDDGARWSGSKKLPITAPQKALRTTAFVWDVSAEDMTQAHFDAIAHEKLVVGEECSPTNNGIPEYCQLIKMQHINGTLQGTAVGRKLESGELKIPDPRFTETQDKATAKRVDFEDTAEVAEAPFETQEPQAKVKAAEVDAEVDAEAAEFDL